MPVPVPVVVVVTVVVVVVEAVAVVVPVVVAGTKILLPSMFQLVQLLSVVAQMNAEKHPVATAVGQLSKRSVQMDLHAFCPQILQRLEHWYLA